LAQPKKKLMQNVKPKSYTSLSKEDVGESKNCFNKFSSHYWKQLKVLIGRVCEQTYDKYLLLEERDKILCKARIKSSDVETGTCEDMCSEKERYVRIIQKRVSPYECNDLGEMIPEIAIKEYSRSAADQEEPLPHELRPTHVLHSVPSRDENLAEWYDFLWNRTRAIRKVSCTFYFLILIEQCVRFHIFASHRLCHLGPNEFDQKMNTENLSKSLQSLRYLYDDLAKRGLLCENEAEIRAYDVMLNLEDSNILRQILTYRREIRESLQMRLALRLFSCFKNGNYIRFFKLLKRNATYLQVYNFLFFTFVKNFYKSIENPFLPNRIFQYPITKLVDILGFDSINDATEFIMNYNMRVDTITEPDDICILLSKSKFYLSTPPVPKMSLWIEEKRLDTPIAQVIFLKIIFIL
uniref:SAC3_GANP domain-containing protein n=1 Tax=Dracunculus medinensis TaxID=318479 RepID=A0A0N4U5W6_DRAME